MQQILHLSLVNYVIDGENAGGENPENGSENPVENGGSENNESENEGNDGGENSEIKKGETPEEKFKRWKISSRKKQEKMNTGNSENQNNSGNDFDDKEVEEYLEKMLAEKEKVLEEKLLKKIADSGVDLSKLDKIDQFEEKLERNEFFNQFEKAGTQFKEYGLDVNPDRAGEILADIEENGFTPNQVILLQNADKIMEKLKSIPKQPTSIDSGKRPKIDRSKVSLKERLAAIRQKHFG